MPAYTPRIRPLLKAIAAATAFTFTVTSLLPMGWAAPQRQTETLRGLQGKEAAGVEAGLEEALQDNQKISEEPASQKLPITLSRKTIWGGRSPVGLEEAGISRRSFLKVAGTAAAGAALGPAAVKAVGQSPSAAPQAVLEEERRIVVAPPGEDIKFTKQGTPLRYLRVSDLPASLSVWRKPKPVGAVSGAGGELGGEIFTQQTGIVPPTHWPRDPERVAKEEAQYWLRTGQELLRSVAEGQVRSQEWKASHSPGQWLVPQGGEAVFTLYDPITLDQLNQTPQGRARVEALWNGLGAVRENRQATVGVAYEARALVTGIGYEALAGSLAEVAHLAGKNIEAARKNGLKVWLMGSASEWAQRARFGEGRSFLLTALSTGLFGRDRIYLDIEPWTTTEWKKAQENNDQETLRILAFNWLAFHEEVVLKEVLPEDRDDWGRTRLHTYVTPEFLKILKEIADKRGKPMNPRIVFELMEYRYPKGYGAGHLAGVLQEARGLHPNVNLALNLRPAGAETVKTVQGFTGVELPVQPDEDLAGRSVDEIRQMVESRQLGPVSVNLREALALMDLARDGKLSAVQRAPADLAIGYVAEGIRQAARRSVGLPVATSRWELQPRPFDKLPEEDRARLLSSWKEGLIQGIIGVAPLYHGPKLLWELHPDAFPEGPEMGTVIKLGSLGVGLVAQGQALVERVDLAVFKKDDRGNKIPGTEIVTKDVLHSNSTLTVPEEGMGAELRVTLRRLVKEEDGLWKKNALVVDFSARVTKGHQSSGDVPRAEWNKIRIEAGQMTHTAVLEVPSLDPGANWITLRAYDVFGEVTELIGPGRDFGLSARYAPTQAALHEAWLKARAAQLADLGREPLEEELSSDLKVAYRILRMRELAVLTGGRADVVARLSLNEAEPYFKNDKLIEELRRKFQLLKESGVTAISLYAPNLEKIYHDYMFYHGETGGAGGAEPASAGTLRELAKLSHEFGIRMGLEVKEEEVEGFLKKMTAAGPQGVLRTVLHANERDILGLDFLSLHTSGKSDAARQKMESFIRSKDLALVVIGPPGGVSSSRLQYAAKADTLKEIEQHIGSDQLEKPRHDRFPRAVALDFDGFDPLLRWLEGMKQVGDPRDPAVMRAYLERLRVPSAETLKEIGVHDPAGIAAVRDYARSKSQKEINNDLASGSHLAVAMVQALEAEIADAASVSLVERYGTWMDQARLAASGVRLTPLVYYGSSRAEVTPLVIHRMPYQGQEPAEIGVKVTNQGNVIGDYDVHFFASHPAWKDGIHHVLSLKLNPGEEAPVWIRLKDLPADQDEVEYRVAVLPRGAELIHPGMPGSLNDGERALARMSGVLFTGGSSGLTDKDLQEEINLFVERQRHKRALGEPVLTPQEWAQRLQDYLGPWATVNFKTDGSIEKISLAGSSWGLFRQRVQEAYQKLKKDQDAPLRLLVQVPPEEAKPELKAKRAVGKLSAWGLLILGLLALGKGALEASRDVGRQRRAELERRLRGQRLGQAGAVAGPAATPTDLFDTTEERSISLEGIGDTYHVRDAAEHPEQGKAHRGLRTAHREEIIVLDAPTQLASENIQRQRVTSLQRFRGRAWKWVAATMFIAAGAVFAITGITWIGVAGAVGAILAVYLLWLGIARVEGIQVRLGRLMEGTGQAVANVRVNEAYSYLSAPLFLALGLKLLGLCKLAGVTTGTFALLGTIGLPTTWMAVAVAGVVGLVLYFSRAWDPPHPATLFRAGGAVGMGLAGSALVLKLSLAGLNPWLFLLLAAPTILFTFGFMTQLMAAARPFEAVVSTLWGAAEGTVKWGSIVLAAAVAVKILHPVVFAWWGGKVVSAGLTGAFLGVSSPYLLAGAALLSFVLLYHRFQLGQALIGQRRELDGWPAFFLGIVVSGIAGAAVAVSLPFVLAFFGLPVTVGGALVAVGFSVVGLSLVNKALIALFLDRGPANLLARGFEAVWQLLLGVGLVKVNLLILSAFPPATVVLWVTYLAWLVFPAILAWGVVKAYGLIPFRYHIQWQFEQHEARREAFPHVLAYLRALSTIRGVVVPVFPAGASLESQLNRLARGVGLSLDQSETLLREFSGRSALDEKPDVFEEYHPGDFQQAWMEAHRRAGEHGVSDRFAANPAPARPSGLLVSQDQMRLINWYYWKVRATRQAIGFLELHNPNVLSGGMTAGTIPSADLEAEFTAAASTMGLTQEDQIELLNHFWTEETKGHMDLILGQDQGTVARTFWQGVWTGRLSQALWQLRQEDSLVAMMPALILSFGWDTDWMGRLPNQRNSMSLRLTRGTGSSIDPPNPLQIVFAVPSLLFHMLRVALMSYAVPLGFMASMTNRHLRSVVQGGNVSNPMGLSADAGVGGYLAPVEYVFKVMGRWLVGHLYVLIRALLGKSIVRNPEEVLGTHRWARKHGTLGRHIEHLAGLEEPVAAGFAALRGEKNTFFDHGDSLLPQSLRREPWDTRRFKDGADSDYFGPDFNRGLAGAMAMRYDRQNLDGVSIYFPSGIAFDNGSMVLTPHPEKFVLQMPHGGLPKDIQANAALSYFQGAIAPEPVYHAGAQRKITFRFQSEEDRYFPESAESREEIYGEDQMTVAHAGEELSDPALEDVIYGRRKGEGNRAAGSILRRWHEREVAKDNLNPVTAPFKGRAGFEAYSDLAGARYQFLLRFAFWLRRQFVGERTMGWGNLIPWVASVGLGAAVIFFLANVWLGGAVAVGPAVIGALLGGIMPLSFIGFFQHSMLQAMKGHYDAALLERAMEGFFEGRRMQDLPAGISAADYLALVREGWDLIRNDPANPAYWSQGLAPNFWQRSLGHSSYSDPPESLREAVMEYARWIDPEHPFYKHRSERYGIRRRLRNLILARLNQIIGGTAGGNRARERHLWRAVREAIMRNTEGELLAVGNPLGGLLYHGSRDRGVARGGDVNSPFGAHGPRRALMEAMMDALEVGVGGDRSWQRSSLTGVRWGSERIPSLIDPDQQQRVMDLLRRWVAVDQNLVPSGDDDAVYAANETKRAAKKIISGQISEVLRERQAPVEAFIEHGAGATATDYFLKTTFLQPDTADTGEFLCEESRLLAQIPDNLSLADVDDSLTQRETRENDLVRYVRMDEAGWSQSKLTSEIRHLKEFVRTHGSVRATAAGWWERRFQSWLEHRPLMADLFTFSKGAAIAAVVALLAGASLWFAVPLGLLGAPALLYWTAKFGNWLFRSFRPTEPYSRELVTLNLITGATREQVIHFAGPLGPVVDLNWSSVDGFFDSSEYDFSVGTYLFPGTSIWRARLWRRRGTKAHSDPIPFLTALLAMQEPSWLAPASGFNRLPTDAYEIGEGTAEDTLFGFINRHTPGKMPTLNADNKHKEDYLSAQEELRKRDEATVRALQLFKGIGIAFAVQHLFDHPLFEAYRTSPGTHETARTIQRLFGWDPVTDSPSGESIFGMEAVWGDEVAAGGWRGAGTFSYGYSGSTGSTLYSKRVGPVPPGYAAASWKYPEYQTIDNHLGGTGANNGPLFVTLRGLQQERLAGLDDQTTTQCLLAGHLVDPWAALAVANEDLFPDLQGRRSRVNSRRAARGQQSAQAQAASTAAVQPLSFQPAPLQPQAPTPQPQTPTLLPEEPVRGEPAPRPEPTPEPDEEDQTPAEGLPVFDLAPTPTEPEEVLTPLPEELPALPELPPAAPAEILAPVAGTPFQLNRTKLEELGVTLEKAEADVKRIARILGRAPDLTLDDFLRKPNYQYLEGNVSSAPPHSAGLEEAAAAVRGANGIFGVSAVNEGPALEVFLFDENSTRRLAPFVADLAPVAVLTATAQEASAIRELFKAGGIPEAQYAVDSLERHRGSRQAAEESLEEHFKRFVPQGKWKVVFQPVPPGLDVKSLTSFFEKHGVMIYNMDGITVGLEEVQTYLENQV